MAEPRFDVVYSRDGGTIEPHFCREWDGDGGCYGTNPDHGMSLEEARAELAEWHERQAQQWRDGTHPNMHQFAPS